MAGGRKGEIGGRAQDEEEEQVVQEKEMEEDEVRIFQTGLDA